MAGETPIRILHIFGRMARGGAEMRTLEIMRHIDRDRYQLHFCVLSGQEGDLDREIRFLGGRVHYCCLDLGFPNRFRRLLRDERFDVVHSHVHYFSGYILRMASKEDIPVRVAHFRNTQDDHLDGGIRRYAQRILMKRWIDRNATQILAVSRAAMRHSWPVRWRDDPRCLVIYNGLDLSPFGSPADKEGVFEEFSVPRDSRLLIHVGRFAPQKNHIRLIDIFAETSRRVPGIYLLLVGKGDNDTEMWARKKSADSGIADKVIFAGERRDVARLLKAADLMIFPSRWEGLPGAVLEACAAGTPVLASELPGIAEIAEHFECLRIMSLERLDRDWAATASELLSGGAMDRRSAMSDVFARSVFNIRNCVESHCIVWQGRSPGKVNSTGSPE